MVRKREGIEFCPFCGRSKSEADILIRGVRGNICSSCVDQISIVIEETPRRERNKDKKATNIEISLEIPQEIKHFLDQHAAEQDSTKRVLSVVVYNHYKRLQQFNVDDEVGMQEGNVIMIGGIGADKTLVTRTTAKMLNVPIAIVDATVLAEAGYVGGDVENILSRLLQAAGYGVAKAGRGIVFIDEMGKIARKSDNPSITRDVSDEGVQ